MLWGGGRGAGVGPELWAASHHDFPEPSGLPRDHGVLLCIPSSVAGGSDDTYFMTGGSSLTATR